MTQMNADGSLLIVRATPADARRLAEIAHAAKRHWGYPERWIESWKETLTISPELIGSNIAFRAMENAQLVGFYLLTTEIDGLHLDHLWVTPPAMGCGIGRALFQHAIEQTRALGQQTLRIEADPNAEGFYKRMGAHRVGMKMTLIEGQRRELPLLQYNLSQ